MWLDVLLSRAENFGVVPTDFAVLILADEAPLQQETQGLQCVIVVDGAFQIHGDSSFASFKTQGRAQPNRVVPVFSILKLNGFVKSLKFALAPPQ